MTSVILTAIGCIFDEYSDNTKWIELMKAVDAVSCSRKDLTWTTLHRYGGESESFRTNIVRDLLSNFSICKYQSICSCGFSQASLSKLAPSHLFGILCRSRVAFYVAEQVFNELV